jgi:hypothetical protein
MTIPAETASDSGPREFEHAGQLIATRTLTIDGERVVAGVTRVAKDHPWARMEHVFAPADSDRGKLAIAQGEEQDRLFMFTKSPRLR